MKNFMELEEKTENFKMTKGDGLLNELGNKNTLHSV